MQRACEYGVLAGFFVLILMANYIEQPLAPDGFSQGPDVPRTPGDKRRFKRRFIIVFTIVALIVIMMLGWSAYGAYLSPEAKERRAMQENYERAERIIGQLQQQEKADIYGGRTPQETLDMFVEAIRDEEKDTQQFEKRMWS